MLKIEITIEAINILVKNIKKAWNGIFTLLLSPLYEQRNIYLKITLCKINI